ncbi:MAG: hypothetical protein AC479_04500 [miscellaneous Crenarchaeota group-6 archaeon AD8-1]|nr:MAG: hypothetical protein AC479_04500 [miscellaneous Crenarchaeota group-6 archaeon AD8-1]
MEFIFLKFFEIIFIISGILLYTIIFIFNEKICSKINWISKFKNSNAFTANQNLKASGITWQKEE